MKFIINGDNTPRDFSLDIVKGINNVDYLTLKMDGKEIYYLSKDGSTAIGDLRNTDLCNCDLEDI